MEKPYSDRVGISTTASGLGLSIEPKRKVGRWSMPWVPLGFAFWVYGVYGAVGELLDANSDRMMVFSTLLLVALVVGAIASVSVFLWKVFGREIVEVYAGRFIVARKLRSIRYRSKSFNTLKIEGLQPKDEPALRSFLRFRPGCGPSTGKVAFEARGSTYRFGESLEEDEAADVAERITSHLPQMRVRA